jgi:hypothetical protein
MRILIVSEYILTADLLGVQIGCFNVSDCILLTKAWWVRTVNNEKQLIEAVLKSATIGQKDGRKSLACASAFKLAREFQTEVIEIGRICNQHNIRICYCQLGCFK